MPTHKNQVYFDPQLKPSILRSPRKNQLNSDFRPWRQVDFDPHYKI